MAQRSPGFHGRHMKAFVRHGTVPYTFALVLASMTHAPCVDIIVLAKPAP
jgi:hypothetical protein